MSRLSAFTLIEILVASSIGALLIALVSGALLGIHRIGEVNQVLMSLHEEAAVSDRKLRAHISAAAAGAKWEFRADPGSDGTWGTGDESITLTWMTTIADSERVNFDFSRDPRMDLTWCRLRWEANGGRPRLLQGMNSGFWIRRPPGATGVNLHNDPLPRRDRRRDLEDNDLRFLPGISPADYSAIAMPGDESDLSGNMTILHGHYIDVKEFRLSIVDRSGWEVVATPGSGLVQRNAAGVTEPWSGGAWENDQKYGIDGVFLDARHHIPVNASRSVAAMRPVLVRLSFTLTERRTGAPSHRQPIALRFDISLPVGQELALP